MAQENKDRIKQNKEHGMMTVEAVLSLVPFILVILGFISFTNVFMVHNKIQYALYQAASELSAYTYFYQALGIRAGDQAMHEDVDRETELVDDGIDQVTAFIGTLGTLNSDYHALGNGELSELEQNLNNMAEHGQTAYEQGGDLLETGRKMASDPQALLRSIVYLGIENGEAWLKSVILRACAAALVENYLDQSYLPAGAQDAGGYLKMYGVVDGMEGLDFSHSSLFSDDEMRMIDIVVEYDIEITFLKVLFTNPTIHVAQRVAIPAWLDGDGGQY